MGPLGGGSSSPRPLCAALQVLSPRCPPVTPGDSSVLAESCTPAHSTAPLSTHPSSQGKENSIRDTAASPVLCLPPVPPQTLGAIHPAIFLLTRGALPGSGMTWGHGDAPSAAGSASQLKVHPRASLLPLSCPPPSFPFFQSLLIILLPALSGSPSPAITPDNCELSAGHGQQSGSSTWETAASTDTSLPSSPPPLPQLPGKLAGLQAGQRDHQGKPPQEQLGSHCPVCLQLR